MSETHDILGLEFMYKYAKKKINSIFHNMIVVLLNNDCILCYEMSRLNEGIILLEMKTTIRGKIMQFSFVVAMGLSLTYLSLE